jgi:sirohydrochlorin cobaltochelatase
MEAAPPVAEAVAAAGTRYVVVAPLFISDGLHAAEDIPVLLGEPPERVQARLAAGQSPWRNPTERGGKLVWYAPSLGEDPRLGEVVLERVREAAGEPAPE